jgi:hypothetical protein
MEYRFGLGCVTMFALEGPGDSLIVAASNAGRAPGSRWGCAAATATCNPIDATTICATLVMSAESIRAVLPVCDLFTGGSHAELHSRDAHEEHHAKAQSWLSSSPIGCRRAGALVA